MTALVKLNKHQMDIREILSIAADIATIITAICATGVAIKIGIQTGDISRKGASQSAKGTNNRQNIRQ